MSDHSVLHIIKYFRPDFTGEGTFIERLTPSMVLLEKNIHHDVLVTLTSNPKRNIRKKSNLRNIFYIRSESNIKSSVDFQVFWWILRFIWRYDVLHFHTHTDRFFLSYLLAKCLGRRLVLSATLSDSVQGIIETYRPLYRPLVRQLCRLFDAYISISPKLDAETTPLVAAGRAHLVPIGINIPELNALVRAQSRRVLNLADDTIATICVGAICRRKDQLFLVRQIAAMRDLNLTLVLVGPILEPDYHATLRAVIDDAGIGGRVIFAGHVEEPWGHYAASDIMVFASKEEGFGTAMIEGMAYGMPIVARLLPGVNDAFIEHGRSGYLFTGDADFQRFLRTLAGDQELRQALGSQGRRFVSDHYQMEKIAKRYLEIYGFSTSDSATQVASASWSSCAVGDVEARQVDS